jgi:predicted nucleic acid-binding protein
LKDADDNKFVDCAVASNADYLVTHDRDFDVLKNVPFPKVKIIDSFGLLDILKNNIQ